MSNPVLIKKLTDRLQLCNAMVIADSLCRHDKKWKAAHDALVKFDAANPKIIEALKLFDINYFPCDYWDSDE